MMREEPSRSDPARVAKGISHRSIPLPAATPGWRRIGSFEIKDSGDPGAPCQILQGRPLGGTSGPTVRLHLIAPPLADSLLDSLEARRCSLRAVRHPSLPSLVDFGKAEDGSLWIAVEDVPGKHLLAHCDERKLGIQARLRLFLQVCEAVEQLHFRGLIHGDLGQNSVCIEEVPGKTVVRIVDAPLAVAATALPLDRVRAIHRHGATLAPERHDDTGPDIRADVYAIGILLETLLIGRTAIEAQGGFESAAHASGPLQTPSQLLNPRSEADRVAATRRDTDLKGLVKSLRGNLDWVVSHARERDPRRRYSTVSELIDDLETHLAGDIVPGRRANFTEKVRAFRKHRPAAAALVVVTLLLAVSAIAAGVWIHQGVRIGKRAAEDRAALAERRGQDLDSQLLSEHSKLLRGEEEVAAGHQRIADLERDLATSWRVSALLESLLARISGPPDGSLAVDIARVQSDLLAGGLSPDIEASLRHHVGRALMNQRALAAATAELERACTLLTESDARPSHVRSCTTDLAAALLQRARDTEPGLERQALLSRATELLGPVSGQDLGFQEVVSLSDEEFAGVREAMPTLARVLELEGRLVESESVLEKLLAFQEERKDPSDQTCPTLRSLADIASSRGRLLAAVGFRARVLDSVEKSGETPAVIGVARARLALAQSDAGKPAEARAEAERALVQVREDQGPDATDAFLAVQAIRCHLLLEHGDTADAEAHATIALGRVSGASAAAVGCIAGLNVVLARLEASRADGEEQFDILTRAVADATRTVGPIHRWTDVARRDLAFRLLDDGDLIRAEEILREAAELHEQIEGPDHHRTLSALEDLAKVLQECDAVKQAELILRRVLESRERTVGRDDLLTLRALVQLGWLLSLSGDLDEADRILNRAQAGLLDRLSYDHPSLLRVRAALASVSLRRGEFQKAKAGLGNLVADCRKVLGSSNVETIEVQNLQALVLRTLGEHTAAERIARNALMAAGSGRDEVSANLRVVSLNLLGSILVEEGRHREAAQAYEKVLESRRRSLGDDDPATLLTLNNLAACRFHTGEMDEAVSLLKSSLDGLEEHYPDGDWRIALARMNLGTCLAKQGRHPEAERVLDPSWRALDAAFGRHDPRTITGIRRMIDLYAAWGRKDKEMEYRAMLP